MLAALAAVRLTAAAMDSGFSPFELLGLPAGHALRAVLLAAAAAVATFLLWLVVRGDDDGVRLASGSGSVLVPRGELAGLAEHAAGRHPEVVRADSDVRAVADGVRVVVRAFARPLADADQVAGEVGALVRADLAGATGLALIEVDVRPRVLRVGQLKRYLP